MDDDPIEVHGLGQTPGHLDAVEHHTAGLERTLRLVATTPVLEHGAG